MRIIAGERKGFKLEGPMDRSIRPTSDLRREAIFNILGPIIENEPFYDIFAGTGAMGLEALSRGARSTVHIELGKKAQDLIRRNILHLRYQDKAKVIPTNAYRWIECHRPKETGIYFIDPPFPEYEMHPTRFSKYLKILMERVLPGAILIVESRWKMNPEVLPDFDTWHLRKYGETRVAYWGLVDEDPEADQDDEAEEATDDDDQFEGIDLEEAEVDEQI